MVTDVREISFDRAFQSEIPLPLARLYARAHHAKGERECHDHAFYLVEAALKLAASALVGRYRLRGEHSERVDETLQHLALPSLGQWRDIFRETLRFLGEAPRFDPWARRVMDALRAPDESLLEILGPLARASGYAGRMSARPTKLEVLELLPTYRNTMSGAHGAVKADKALYRVATSALLALSRTLLEGGAILGGGTLLFAEDVRVGREGEHRVVWMDLTGPTAVRRKVFEGEPTSERILPGRAFLEVSPEEHIPLHPLVHYRPEELLDQVFFLNRIRRGKSGIQFLCYDTGDFYLPGRDALGDTLVRELEELLSEILARKVDSKERESLAERSRSDAREAGEAAVEEEAEPTGTLLGDFEILGELGRGGMAVVYQARQRSLGRTVALKVLPPGLKDDPVALARFQQEVRALSRCDHPNVVKILSAGEATGSSYYAMEYIDGGDVAAIARALKRYQSSSGGALSEEAFDRAASSASALEAEGAGLPESQPVERGELPRLGGRDIAFRIASTIRDAARGVQHIHDHGIIHRDLKPQNIMVTRDDHRPVVMDLGLAKMADVSRSLSIEKGSILGTLRYMPPEQLQRNLLEVDARADVYALGAVLYELACLRPMLDGETEERLTAQILFEEPPPAQKVNPRIPTDLATIIAKATRKDPKERFGSAQEMADDLDRFVHGEAIRARPPTPGYLLKVFLKQHRLAVGAAAAFVLLVILAAAALSVLYVRSERTVRKLYFGQVAAAQGAYDRGEIGQFRRLLDACPVKLRHWEWYHLNYLRYRLDREGKTLGVHEGSVDSVAFSPDGNSVASIGSEGVVKVWDSASGRERLAFRAHDPSAETKLAFSSDGERLVTGSVGNPIVRVWDATTGKHLMDLPGRPPGAYSIACSPKGAPPMIAAGGMDGSIGVWDASTGGELLSLPPHTSKVYGVVFSPDGTRLASSSWDGIKLWDVRSGKRLPSILPAATAIAWSPDGRRLAAGSHFLKVFDASTFKEELELAGHRSRIDTVAFSADGARILSCGFDKVIKVWSASSGKEILTLRGHEAYVWATFSPGGRRIVSGSYDGTVKLWRLDLPPEPLALPLRGLRGFAFSPDGRWLVLELQEQIIILEFPDGAPRARLPGTGGPSAFSPDGALLATAGAGGSVILRETGTWKKAQTLDAKSPVAALSFSPQGNTLAAGCTAQGAGRSPLRFWQRDPEGTWVARGSAQADGDIALLAFSPDGSRLAVGLWRFGRGERGSLLVIGSPTGEELRAIPAFSDVHGVAFSPDGAHLISVESSYLCVRDARTYELVRPPILLPVGYGLAISPDGRRILVNCFDSTLRLWDLQSGDEALTLPHAGPILRDVAFAPDGSIVSARHDEILIWRTARSEQDFERAQEPLENAPLLGLDPSGPDWKFWLQVACVRINRRGAGAGGEERRHEFRRFLERAREQTVGAGDFFDAVEHFVLEPQRWLIAGPFPGGPDHEGLDRVHPPELSIDAGGYDGKAGHIDWKPVAIEVLDGRPGWLTLSGYVDLLELYPQAENVVAYALAYIQSDREERVTLRLGADDAVKVRLNGEWIPELERRLYRPFVPEEDHHDATLRPGTNEILLKIENGIRDWGFALQAVDARGWPARLTWKTTP